MITIFMQHGKNMVFPQYSKTPGNSNSIIITNVVIPNLFLPSKIKEKNVSTVFVYKMKVSGSKTTPKTEPQHSDFQCIDKNRETILECIIP